MFGGVGGRAFWVNVARLTVVAWRVGMGCLVVYVDIFKVQMDIGDARLGRKRRRSWRKSRDVNYCSEHRNTFTMRRKHFKAIESEVCKLCGV